MLVGELLATDLPAGLRELLVDRSEGNPFFVEELLGMLIDRGVLARENGRWTVSESASEIDVPDSVQALLAARIDLLDPTDKEALQTAAVIGRVFWTGPVYELLADEPDFRALEERDFIRLRSGSSIPGQREYAIKHALTREVAYASLPRARRARLHAGFAAWLERFAGASGDEYAPLLAHHYAEAVRPEDVDLAWSGEEPELAKLRESAILWLRRAAELAVGRYEIDEGLILLHRAVALEPDPRKQAELWEEIGHANVLRFAGEDFRAAMENAIELAGPSAELYTELALQTARRTGMWQQAPDRELVDGWIERALELVEEGSPTYAKALAAVALWRKDEAAARALHAIAMRSGDAALRSSALAALADVAWSAGDLEQAHLWLEERLALVPVLTDPDDCHFAYMSAIEVDLATGRLPAAARMSALLMEMVEGLTPHHRLHGVDVPDPCGDPCGPLGRGTGTDIAGRAGSGGERGHSLCRNRRAVPHPRGARARTAATTPEHAGSRRGLTRSASRPGGGSTNRRGSGWRSPGTTSPSSGDWSIPRVSERSATRSSSTELRRFSMRSSHSAIASASSPRHRNGCGKEPTWSRSPFARSASYVTMRASSNGQRIGSTRSASTGTPLGRARVSSRTSSPR